MTTTYAFPADRVARGLAIKQQYANLGAAGSRYRPSRIALLGPAEADSTADLTKRLVFSAQEVGTIYGYKSPLYTAALALLPPNGDGVGAIPVTVYPVATPTSGDVQAAGSITPTGTITKKGTYRVQIGGIDAPEVTIDTGDTVASFCDAVVLSINSVLGMPGTAADGTTKVDFTVGFAGAAGNEVLIKVFSPDDAELSFVIVQPKDGAGSFSTDDALAQMGNVWETHIVNCFGYNEDICDELQAFGEGRRLPEVHKAVVAFCGSGEADPATLIAITDERKTDSTNVIVPNPGSYDLPWVIAARAVARVATLANANPSHDYARQSLTGLSQGTDGEQWTSAQRDAAVKAGVSTVEVIDGEVVLSDVVTMYHPTGEEPPAYRYVCDLAKLDTVIYNVDLIFGSKDWAGAPLVPDAQAVKNPTAKKPKMALTALSNLFDALAEDAIIADPDFARANTTADINSTNPKRLDVRVVVKLAGNSNVISVDVNFGFNYGG